MLAAFNERHKPKEEEVFEEGESMSPATFLARMGAVRGIPEVGTQKVREAE